MLTQRDKENIQLTMGLLVVFGAILGLLWIGYVFGHLDGYRAGQIDAISGRRVVYQLTDMDDGSKTWEKTK